MKNRDHYDPPGVNLLPILSLPLALNPVRSYRMLRQHYDQHVGLLDALVDLGRNGLTYPDLPFVKPYVMTTVSEVNGE